MYKRCFSSGHLWFPRYQWRHTHHHIGSFTNNFSWKNFSLGIFCTFTFDRDVLNLFKSDRFSNSTAGDPYQNFVRLSIPDLNKLNIRRQPGDRAEYAKYDLAPIVTTIHRHKL
jgi:hypothetical protein